MEELGAELLLVCSNVSPDAIDDDALAAAQLRELAERAAARGLRIAYEALAWGRHVDDYEHAWRIVERADHPALGVCLDSFHILSRGSDPAGIERHPRREALLRPARRRAAAGDGRAAVEPPPPLLPRPGRASTSAAFSRTCSPPATRAAVARGLQRRLPRRRPAPDGGRRDALAARARGRAAACAGARRLRVRRGRRRGHRAAAAGLGFAAPGATAPSRSSCGSRATSAWWSTTATSRAWRRSPSRAPIRNARSPAPRSCSRRCSTARAGRARPTSLRSRAPDGTSVFFCPPDAGWVADFVPEGRARRRPARRASTTSRWRSRSTPSTRRRCSTAPCSRWTSTAARSSPRRTGWSAAARSSGGGVRLALNVPLLPDHGPAELQHVAFATADVKAAVRRARARGRADARRSPRTTTTTWRRGSASTPTELRELGLLYDRDARRRRAAAGFTADARARVLRAARAPRRLRRLRRRQHTSPHGRATHLTGGDAWPHARHPSKPRSPARSAACSSTTTSSSTAPPPRWCSARCSSPTPTRRPATLLSFATYGVGYVARPIGAFFMGHLGDRYGRKRVLVLTVVMMGVSTFLVGCLPTYDDIGLWAPALLVALRLMQGFSASGEQSGGNSLTLEHAPDERRAFFSSFTLTGTQAGLVIATAVWLPIGAMPEHDLLTLGLADPVLAERRRRAWPASLIRRRLDETPAFAEAAREGAIERAPLRRAAARPSRQRPARDAGRARLHRQHDLRRLRALVRGRRQRARQDDHAVGRDRHQRRRAGRHPGMGGARRPDRPQAGADRRHALERRADVRLPRRDRQPAATSSSSSLRSPCPASPTARSTASSRPSTARCSRPKCASPAWPSARRSATPSAASRRQPRPPSTAAAGSRSRSTSLASA